MTVYDWYEGGDQVYCIAFMSSVISLIHLCNSKRCIFMPGINEVKYTIVHFMYIKYIFMYIKYIK